MPNKDFVFGYNIPATQKKGPKSACAYTVDGLFSVFGYKILATQKKGTKKCLLVIFSILSHSFGFFLIITDFFRFFPMITDSFRFLSILSDYYRIFPMTSDDFDFIFRWFRVRNDKRINYSAPDTQTDRLTVAYVFPRKRFQKEAQHT